MGLDRRTFLRTTVAGAAALGLGPSLAAAPAGTPEAVPRRRLGRTGVEVSILGVGGYHLGSIRDPETAIRLVRTALDAGVNFLDNAWEYHQGRSEALMGRALKDGYRDKAFLMTKIHGRTAARARRQLDESLKRLGVDHVDLLQVHEIVYEDDPERVFADDGMMPVLLEAKRAGKARFIGFTGHKSPSLHLEMLGRSEAWDTVQMPVNAFDPHFHSFIRHVLPVAQARGLGIVGMKSLGGGYLLRSGHLTPEAGLRFAWSQPVSTVVSGMDELRVLEANLALARRFKPLEDAERQALLASTQAPALEGRWEPFKSADTFDGGFGAGLHGMEADR